jgi:leader peptidase (prepilin peptidase)/N-methyltransferase
MEASSPEFLPGRASLLAGAVLGVALFGAFCTVLPVGAAAATACLAVTMGLIALTDFRHFIIPDVLSLPAIPLGLIANAMVLQGGDWGAGLQQGLQGALIGGGVFLVLREGYYRLRHVEGLGLGDVKLAAAAGAWLGPAALAPACMVAAVSALLSTLVYAIFAGSSALNQKMHIPFGSFIAPTIFAFWLWSLSSIDAFR